GPCRSSTPPLSAVTIPSCPRADAGHQVQRVPFGSCDCFRVPFHRWHGRSGVRARPHLRASRRENLRRNQRALLILPSLIRTSQRITCQRFYIRILAITSSCTLDQIASFSSI